MEMEDEVQGVFSKNFILGDLKFLNPVVCGTMTTTILIFKNVFMTNLFWSFKQESIYVISVRISFETKIFIWNYFQNIRFLSLLALFPVFHIYILKPWEPHHGFIFRKYLVFFILPQILIGQITIVPLFLQGIAEFNKILILINEQNLSEMTELLILILSVLGTVTKSIKEVGCSQKYKLYLLTNVKKERQKRKKICLTFQLCLVGCCA